MRLNIMNKKLVAIAIATATLAACGGEKAADNTAEIIETETMTIPNDPHSYAEPNQAVVTHLDLDIDVDFALKRIKGVASYIIDNKTGTDKIVLDVNGLIIKNISISENNSGTKKFGYSSDKGFYSESEPSFEGATTEFKLGENDEILGQALTIIIKPETKRINIEYETTDGARALQWLDAQQTAGKKYPFMFTQSQAILARTWLPCQDSPGIRYTYNARVKVPEYMLALMSATNPTEKNATGIYEFEMNQPIPSYLMALSVGDLAFKDMGGQTGVYAEPSLLEASAYEFAETKDMLVAAENLYGPYAWERYDILVLPPSFPFGGMENPRLTFATPTIIAGDRSLVSLVAHELAHSWSGNLVTNATWNDFWLNEGFTVYFEHRIMEAVYGRDYSEMLASLTKQELLDELEVMMVDAPKDTHLKLNLEGRDPDEGLTTIAYNKGYLFLRKIEETIGRERFDEFLKNHFQSNKFQIMDTEQFVENLNELLSEEEKATVYVDAWVYGEGLPENSPEPESDRFAKVDAELEKWNNGAAASSLATSEWSTHEWLHFINSLPEEIATNRMADLDAAFDFTHSGNNEILGAWWQPAINNNYAPAMPEIEKFLITVGRRKFLTPTYKALKDNGKLAKAKEIYTKARPNYHFVSIQTMDALLDFRAQENE